MVCVGEFYLETHMSVLEFYHETHMSVLESFTMKHTCLCWRVFP